MFTLTQALKAIENKPEFSVKNRGDFVVIDYILTTKDTFVGRDAHESAILLNLRGAAFDATDGYLIRLPYHKFFNYGEFPETDKMLDFGHTHRITQKLDGSMIAPIYAKSGTRLGTRAGVTDVSALAENFIKDKNNYHEFIASCYHYGYTPIFEYCSMQNRVVIAYPESKMILTAIRYMDLGYYLTYKAMVAFATRFDIPVVDSVSNVDNGSFNAFLGHVSKLQNDEGVVIAFEYGPMKDHMVKIKANEYCIKHKTLDGIRLEKNALAMILNNLLDDVLPILSYDVAEKLLNYQYAFNTAMFNFANTIKQNYEKFSHLDSQKDFALAIKDNPYQKFLFVMRKNPDDLFSMVKSYCLKNIGSSSDVDDLKILLNFHTVYDI